MRPAIPITEAVALADRLGLTPPRSISNALTPIGRRTWMNGHGVVIRNEQGRYAVYRPDLTLLRHTARLGEARTASHDARTPA